nr:probable receptor-like protein kinase At5g47070 isoform X1 [Ipomoea batatas]
MKCFRPCNAEKREDPKISKSNLGISSCSGFSEFDVTLASASLNASDTSTDSRGRSQFPNLSDRPSDLRVFTFTELKETTKNFNRSTKIGEGGFGSVYKGTVKSPEDPSSKIDVAIKQLSRTGMQGHKEWVTEVNVLGVAEHENLVKLIGYCAEDGERGIQRLLVYEYMPNRSVDSHLSARLGTPLSWAMRLKIARDAARGLAYLHEGMDFQVVGTMGYASPEYIQTGHLTSKHDVWSYGMFLYELITGRRPLDRNRPKNEQKLLDWVKPLTTDPKKFRKILDPRLEGNFVRSAHKLSLIANRCLVKNPKSRPTMSEVLEMVSNVVEAPAGTGNPRPAIKSPKPVRAKEETDRKGKRRMINIRIGDSGWLVRMLSLKRAKMTS